MLKELADDALEALHHHGRWTLFSPSHNREIRRRRNHQIIPTSQPNRGQAPKDTILLTYIQRLVCKEEGEGQGRLPNRPNSSSLSSICLPRPIPIDSLGRGTSAREPSAVPGGDQRKETYAEVNECSKRNQKGKWTKGSTWEKRRRRSEGYWEGFSGGGIGEGMQRGQAPWSSWSPPSWPWSKLCLGCGRRS